MEDELSECVEASGPSVEVGEGGIGLGLELRQHCGTLTSSGHSDGVAAESGPSVVVWELSLWATEGPCCCGSFLELPSSATDSSLVAAVAVGAPLPPPPPLIWLELRLSMSSSMASSSPSSGPLSLPTPPPAPTPCSDVLLSSTESPGCKACWEERGCCVMMSVDVNEDTPEDDGAETSLPDSLPTEAGVERERQEERQRERRMGRQTDRQTEIGDGQRDIEYKC